MEFNMAMLSDSYGIVKPKGFITGGSIKLQYVQAIISSRKVHPPEKQFPKTKTMSPVWRVRSTFIDFLNNKL